MIKTLHVELITKQEGQYTLYVFGDLEQPNDSIDKYIMVCKLPNWSGPFPELGDKGYIQIDIVNAGEKYYRRDTGELVNYNYTANYFLNFIKEQEKINNKEFKF